MTTLIFTHYGNSSYLPYTLNKASASNPNAHRILIGDSSNRAVATECGWDHIDLTEFRSAKRDAFNAAFYWVQGSNHNPVKGGKDWLRYVSERFFVIESFCHTQKIEKFWHFDSDTMILHDLECYESDMLEKRLDCTTLCNDSCPSGFIKTELVESFTESMINDYQDREFLLSQQREFDNINLDFAFTEMRAFAKFRKHSDITSKRLSTIFQERGIWFDDCICQGHDFHVAWGDKAGRSIKDLYCRGGEIYAAKTNGVEFCLASINCSWVPIKVFEWIQAASKDKEIEDLHPRLSGHLQFSRTERLKDILVKTKSGIKRIAQNVMS